MCTFKFLAANPYYAKRIHEEEEHEYRNCFERDCDRILYSKEFKRLDRKTQVFVAGFDDHTRNRLTHTIEVAQIAKTIALHLGLDENLTAAISYGHDVGHTPFGHIGERTLNYFLNGCGNPYDFKNIQDNYKGFKHNWQSIRVVTELEKISEEFDGLNLTNFTLWGILNHTNLATDNCEYLSKEGYCNYRHKHDSCDKKKENLSLDFYNRYRSSNKEDAWTIEGLIVRIADEIAQRHHDLEDGLFAHIIEEDEIYELFQPLSRWFNKKEILRLATLPTSSTLGIFVYSLSSLLINFFVTDLVKQTSKNLNKLIKRYSLKDSDSFHQKKRIIFQNEKIFNLVSYSPSTRKCERTIHNFLKNRILNSQITQNMDGKSTFVLNRIIKAYLNNPQQLPDRTIHTLYMRYLTPYAKATIQDFTYKQKIGYLREKLKKDHRKINTFTYRNILLRTICDFIAGMTDDFAISQYNKLYRSKNVFTNY